MLGRDRRVIAYIRVEVLTVQTGLRTLNNEAPTSIHTHQNILETVQTGDCVLFYFMNMLH